MKMLEIIQPTLKASCLFQNLECGTTPTRRPGCL